MPYIPQEDRKQLNDAITLLAESIKSNSETTTLAGNLNYSITSLLVKVYGGNLRYFQHNEIIGLLECAKQEFYRRQTATYEDKKRIENEDVYD